MNVPHPYDDTLRYLEQQKRWERRLDQLQRSTYQIIGVGVVLWPLTYLFPRYGVWVACVLLAWAVIPPAAAFTLDGLEALSRLYNRPRP